jgi:formylglycine-generating enzyme required for sulfatase activity
MKLILFLLFFIVQFSVNARSLQKVFVKGGELKLKDSTIIVSDFAITKYEVTNKQYALFLNDQKIGADGILKNIIIINVSSADLQLEFSHNTWRSKKAKENFPMVMVNYYGANAYCNWVGGFLPTENQWMFAAKGGVKSNDYDFAGSNSYSELGWYKDNSEAHLHRIGLKKPNELGIYDMSGNVWEWCLNDSLKSNSDFCVHKGGSWYATEQNGRIDAHYGNTPMHFSNSVGFRVLFLP